MGYAMVLQNFCNGRSASNTSSASNRTKLLQNCATLLFWGTLPSFATVSSYERLNMKQLSIRRPSKPWLAGLRFTAREIIGGIAMLQYTLAIIVAACSFCGAQLLHEKPYTWVVVATFKNESTIISDWLDHYFHEGADHFYLIDNGSMDDYLNKVQRFPQEMITIVRDSSPPRIALQDKLMKKYITQHIINEAHWVLVVDIDEYVYPSDPDLCIADVLTAQPQTVNRIWLPWKVFGANGHLVQPKEGIASGFTKRKSVEYSMAVPSLGYGKSFTRVKDKLLMMTHCSGNGDPALFYSNGSKIIYGDEHTKVVLHDEEVQHHDLQLNHYMFQSRDYYEKIKCARGGGQSGRVSKYTMEFYNKHEPHANAVKDTGLMERYKRGDRKHKCLSKFVRTGENLH